MLTELYIEALLVDEELADQVWELWDRGVIDGGLAAIAWMLLAASYATSSAQYLEIRCCVDRLKSQPKGDTIDSGLGIARRMDSGDRVIGNVLDFSF